MSRRKLALGIGSTAAEKGIVAGVQLLLLPVLANGWGLELYGIWAVMYTIPGFLVLSDFGIVTSAWARMTDFVSRGQEDRARTVLHTAWLVTALIGAALVALLASVLWALPPGTLPVSSTLTEAQSRHTLFVLVAYGVMTVPFKLGTCVLSATNRYSLSAWSMAAVFFVENMALLIAVLAGAGLPEAALVLFVARLSALLVLLALVARLTPQLAVGIGGARWAEWRALWRPALSASVFTIGFLGFMQGSVVALGIAAGAAAVPAFVAVRTLSRIGLQATVLVIHPAAQQFGHEMAKGDHYRAGRYLGLVAASTLVLAGGMAVAFTAFGQPAIELWTGGAIRPPWALVALMALASLMGALWNGVSNFLLIVNRPQAIAIASIAGGTAGIVLILVLGGRLGSPAVGIACALTDLVILLAAIRFVWRHWWQNPEFRRGAMASLSDFAAPLAMLRALRRRGS